MRFSTIGLRGVGLLLAAVSASLAAEPGGLREARANRPVLLRRDQRGRHQSRWPPGHRGRALLV